MKEYSRNNIPLAKKLRKNMTPWERKLWYEFLCRYHVRFQRQKAIGEYIVDFYCAKARLVVELDGGGHYNKEQAAADDCRTKALESMGLRVVRICNMDIDRNFRGVCEYIDMETRKSLPQSASLTAPSSEGACHPRQKNGRIFALGFFDGVHLGHQTLLYACRRMAEQTGVGTAAITFENHPQALFVKDIPALLQSTADRCHMLQQYGVDTVLTYPVNQAVMGLHWRDFLTELLRYHGAAGFVCGHDFRFGHKGEGNAEKLRSFCEEKGLPCAVVPEQTLDGVRISSTHIRGLIEQGDMQTAAKFLGHPHILSGEVVAGRQVGRTIGIPTANILIPEGVAVPKLGVYACRCRIGDRVYSAVTNIGFRPTVGGHQTRAESWILDFDGDLYGKTITLEFISMLRPEEKFPSLEALQTQIHRDAQQARNILE